MLAPVSVAHAADIDPDPQEAVPAETQHPQPSPDESPEPSNAGDIETLSAETPEPLSDENAKALASVLASVKIQGSAKVGNRLKVKQTLNAPSGLETRVVHTWYADSAKVGSGSGYEIKAKDRNKRIKVVTSVAWDANAFYAAGDATATSQRTAKVVKQKAEVKIKRVKISGKAVVGKKLKAKVSLKKPKDLKAKGTYTWYVGGKKVKTGKSLRVKKAHANKTVKVIYKVTWKSDKYESGKKSKSAKKTARYDLSPAAIAKTARAATGIPYAWGGSSRRGADCSGLVKYVYAQHGIKLPGTDSGIAAQGKRVASPKPGDVVRWPGHVAIYVGKGQMVEAQMPGTRSTVTPLRGGGGYYRMT